MRSYVIITDSSCDLTAAMAQDLGVRVVQLAVLAEGYPARPNDQIDVAEFYSELRQKKKATTSAASIDTFLTVFDEYLSQGEDVLYLAFSSGLSGTYNASFVAAQEMREKYPERKIATVDTLAASMGQGLLVYLAAKKKQAVEDFDSVKSFVENNRLNLCHWFTVDDLFFLLRGGRVSAAKAVLGTMLAVKPILHVDNAGHLINVGKARGRRGSIDELFERVKKNAWSNIAEQTVFISHGDCLAEAEYLADRLKNELGVKDIVISYIGAVIGAHSGPGTVAVFFLGDER